MPKPKKRANAATALLKAIGKPKNINTVDVETQPCVLAWLKLREEERATIVGELATALTALRDQPVWHDIKSSAWNGQHEFTQMVALGKAIDRMLRARLPLSEATLTALCRICVDRADFSVKHLTSQLEHYGKDQVVGPDLRAAMVAITERFAWSDYDAVRARLAWLIAPAQAERVGVAPTT